jgi:hypothetical protein
MMQLGLTERTSQCDGGSSFCEGLESRPEWVRDARTAVLKERSPQANLRRQHLNSDTRQNFQGFFACFTVSQRPLF